MLFGFLQGIRNEIKMVPIGVSSLIFTSNTLPVGCFFTVAALLTVLFFTGAVFFAAILGLKVFIPPIPLFLSRSVPAGAVFLEDDVVFLFRLPNTLQLTSRETVVHDGGANADTCSICIIHKSAISAANTKMFLLRNIMLIGRPHCGRMGRMRHEEEEVFHNRESHVVGSWTADEIRARALSNTNNTTMMQR